MVQVKSRNPFTPSFGTTPPLLVGRDDQLAAFDEALDEPGTPGRATLYTGARGVGKTVMLNAVRDLARRSSWEVIEETATAGMLDRLVNEALPELLAVHDGDGTKRRLTGASLPGNLGGLTWTTTEGHRVAPGLRNQMTQLTALMADEGAGLLLTIDELHKGEFRALSEIGAVVQHAFREDQELAFAGAGLSAYVDALIAVPGLTFLTRSDQHKLGAVKASEVAKALKSPIEAGGRAISPEALALAVAATDRYPFMIQLVGHHIWRQNPTVREISASDVEVGVQAARRRMGSLVYEPTLKDMSDVDRTFLLAMARDDGPSQVRDIAERLGTDTNYVSQYRLRLIAADVVVPAGRGMVDFVLPHLRDYLQDHAASLVDDGPTPPSP